MRISLTVDFADESEASTFFGIAAEAFSRMKKAVKSAATAAVAVAAERTALPAPEAEEQTELFAGGGEVPAAALPKRGPRRTRKKVETPAAPAAPAPAAPATPAAGSENDPDYLLADLRAAGTELAKKKSGAAVLEILKEYNVLKYPDLTGPQRKEVLEKLRQAVDG
jgi:hypothetical protein